MDVKHCTNPQNTSQIRQSVFNAVMKFCKCDTEDDVETVGMKAENFGYVISFYGSVDSNYQLLVDEFGHFHKGKWVECDPTDEQMSTMKSLLKMEVEKVQKLIDDEELEYAYAMQSQADELRHGHPGAIYGKWY